MSQTMEYAIRNMSGRELDAFVAEHVMGGFVENPDDWSDKCEVWYWLHPTQGVLRGEPYTFDLMDGKYSHSWREFHPSNDIGDAWMVIDRIREIDSHWSVAINDSGIHGRWVVDVRYYGETRGEYKAFEFSDDHICVAICKAMLFTVFEVE